MANSPFAFKRLAGWSVAALLGWTGCGPGIHLGPTDLNSSTVIFSSRMSLSGVSNGTATESENIWCTKTDEASFHPLTSNINPLLGSFAPTVSADGGKVAFQSLTAVNGSFNSTASDSYNIWIMNVDGSGLTALTKNQNASLHSRAPSFSPDCSTIAFSSNTALSGAWNGSSNGAYNIWTVKTGGTGLTALTQNTSAGLSSFTPVFSPDGTRIAFASMMDLSGNWNGTRTPLNIWIMNADGTGRTPLTRNTNTLATLDSQRPVFSPDGTKIAFTSSTALNGDWNGTSAGTDNIWIMNVDGSGRTALTKNQGVSAASANPEFSPDGTWIAFQSKMSLTGTWSATPATTDNLWLVHPDGTGLTALTQSQNAACTLPVFNADGSALFFWSRGALDGNWDTSNPVDTDNLWTLTVSTLKKSALTQNTNASFNATLTAPAVVRAGVCK